MEVKKRLLERLFIVNKKTRLFNSHPHKITDWDWALNETETRLAKSKRSYIRFGWYTAIVALLAIVYIVLAWYDDRPVYKMIIPALLFISNLDTFYEKKELVTALEEQVFLCRIMIQVDEEVLQEK